MGDNNTPETTLRGAEFLTGIFLFFFGLPFTSVPFVILYGVGFSFDGITLFLCMFSIPFLMAGLMVQTLGINSIYEGLTGKVLLSMGKMNQFDDEDDGDVDVGHHGATVANKVSDVYPSYEELQRQIHGEKDASAEAPSVNEVPETQPVSADPDTGAFWSLSDQDEPQD
ncbi:MAG: hypothetical protein L7U25_03265 [Candidatus Poseidonia sp.]|nr:hypothetical protein [Poseidonia sp.]